jgi:hypothetical protein
MICISNDKAEWRVRPLSPQIAFAHGLAIPPAVPTV